MPPLENNRHERFAQGLAKGLSASEAYVQAGYKPHDGNCSRLRGNERVASRLLELQSRSSKKVEVTAETIVRELEEARIKAMSNDQISAAVSASMGKAKLLGLIVERKQVTGAIGTYDLAKVTDEQIDQLESILGPLADLGGDQSGEGA